MQYKGLLDSFINPIIHTVNKYILSFSEMCQGLSASWNNKKYNLRPQSAYTLVQYFHWAATLIKEANQIYMNVRIHTYT